MVSDTAADESAIIPLDTIALRPGAGRAKPRADPTACPEFSRHAAGDAAADGAHTRVAPAPLQHAAATG